MSDDGKKVDKTLLVAGASLLLSGLTLALLFDKKKAGERVDSVKNVFKKDKDKED